VFLLLMNSGGVREPRWRRRSSTPRAFVVTVLILPESKGKTLEELNAEANIGTSEREAPLAKAMTARAGRGSGCAARLPLMRLAEVRRGQERVVG
jgi:hypothetical protein